LRSDTRWSTSCVRTIPRPRSGRCVRLPGSAAPGSTPVPGSGRATWTCVIPSRRSCWRFPGMATAASRTPWRGRVADQSQTRVAGPARGIPALLSQTQLRADD
jgi:hypothetical protein